MDNQFEGWYGHQFRKEEKTWNLLKSNAEEKLFQDLKSGKVKAGDENWRRQCECIEEFDRMASDLNTRYNEND